jgi:ABC-2 type transport system ATP-binding protein
VTTPALVVRNLRKRYGAVEAVRGVSFEVEAGEVFGLLGPNGAGKTTTVECVLGLRAPDGGAIEVLGIDALRRPGEVKQRVGAALQTTALQDRLTPREALTLFGSFYRQHAEPGVLLERFGLEGKADAPFETLSGGQRQRLALALAFVNLPGLVVLDEPTTGLDPQSRRELHREIGRMRREGSTVLLTTHSMEEAERLCDRVAIVDRGRVIASGAPGELISRSAAAASVSLETDRPVEWELLAALPGAAGLEQEGNRARFRTAQSGAALSALVSLLDARGYEVRELHVERATLEDVFLELTAEAEGE